MSDKFRIKKDRVVPLLETKFIKVYDLQYARGNTTMTPQDEICKT